MSYQVDQPVMLNHIEGFGGLGRIVGIREGDFPYKVRLDDGTQPDLWVHEKEVQPMIDSRPATYEHIQTVQRIMGRVIADLLNRQQVHDQSKLASPEREVFDEFTPKLAGSTYGSDEYKSYLAGMKPALDHHYAANSHHPEHYADGIRGMNLLDVVEMLCDWAAACQRHADGDIRKSIEINQKRFGYSDELKQILLNTLPLIDNK